MSQTPTLDERISSLAAADCRYEADAYHFVFRALDFVLDRQTAQLDEGGDDPHVSAIQLLEGLREFALELYGPLARLVLEHWGIYRTEDFGEIVFGLVECRLLNKQESDRKSDFRNGFNFREAFDKARSAVAPLQ
ncbi:MAG: hypothetical protein P8N09_05265 [Planctomycetota bacterium]|jgi:uncharacterized repeat protein (TIGR04138 family)|nr:hypothetical protein [Planctomycetota bacterium]